VANTLQPITGQYCSKIFSPKQLFFASQPTDPALPSKEKHTHRQKKKKTPRKKKKNYYTTQKMFFSKQKTKIPIAVWITTARPQSSFV